MAKLTLTNITAGYGSNTAFNANFAAIVTALENTLSRDGTTPNTMSVNFDMNGYRVVNLASPVNGNDAARLVDIQASSVGMPSQTGNANKFLKTDGTVATWSDLLNAAQINLSNTSTSIIINKTLAGGSSQIYFIDNGTAKWNLGAFNIGIGAANDYGLYNYGTSTNTFNVEYATSKTTFYGQLVGKGTATNDSAAAGYIGEYINSTILVGSGVSMSSTGTSNITSISLTAGDWDVWGQVSGSFFGTPSGFYGGTNTVSATLPTAPNEGAYFAMGNSGFSAGGGLAIPIGMRRYSLATTTTIYLVSRMDFTSTATGYGFLGARRVR